MTRRAPCMQARKNKMKKSQHDERGAMHAGKKVKNKEKST